MSDIGVDVGITDILSRVLTVTVHCDWEDKRTAHLSQLSLAVAYVYMYM